MPVGTVLFTSRAPIGYVAIAANPISTNQGFKSIVPYVPDCSRFIALVMKTFSPAIDAKAPGTTFKEVSGKIVAGVPFPLPPLAEQHRIVAKVDELMALCDGLEAARAKRETTREQLAAASLARLNAPDPESATFRNHAGFAIENLAPLTTRVDQIKQLRQAILNLAVRGKLVEQDPNDESASELLKRIPLKNAGEGKKNKPTTGLNRSIPGFETPTGWVITDLQSVCASITDGDHLPPPKTDSGIPFLVIGNVRSQTIEFAGSRFVSVEYYESLDPRFVAQQVATFFTRWSGHTGYPSSSATINVSAFSATSAYCGRPSSSMWRSSPVHWKAVWFSSKQPLVQQASHKRRFRFPVSGGS